MQTLWKHCGCSYANTHCSSVASLLTSSPTEHGPYSVSVRIPPKKKEKKIPQSQHLILVAAVPAAAATSLPLLLSVEDRADAVKPGRHLSSLSFPLLLSVPSSPLPENLYVESMYRGDATCIAMHQSRWWTERARLEVVELLCRIAAAAAALFSCIGHAPPSCTARIRRARGLAVSSPGDAVCAGHRRRRPCRGAAGGSQRLRPWSGRCGGHSSCEESRAATRGCLWICDRADLRRHADVSFVQAP